MARRSPPGAHCAASVHPEPPDVPDGSAFNPPAHTGSTLMITLHLFWFHGWNVLAYVGSSEPVLLGFRYTNKSTAEGLLKSQLRKAMRLFPERNVLPGRELYFTAKGFQQKNMSEDKCPAMGDLSDFLPVTITATEG